MFSIKLALEKLELCFPIEKPKFRIFSTISPYWSVLSVFNLIRQHGRGDSLNFPEFSETIC